MERYSGGLKGFWKKRRAYQKLDGPEDQGWGRRWRSKNQHRVELARPGGGGGGDGQRRRRFWRIKVTPRIGVFRRVIFPGKLFAGIRDGYVRMMMRISKCGAIRGGSGAYGCGYVADLSSELARAPVKEYDRKMIIEIYTALMAQGHLLPAANNATTPTAQIVSRR